MIYFDNKGKYILADRDIFKENNVSHKERRKFLENYIKKNLRIEIKNRDTGNILKINKNSTKYASPRNSVKEIYIKGRLIGNMDEVFEISNFERWESSKKAKGVDTKRNPGIGKKGFDFYTFRFAIPTQEGMTTYDAELKVNKESTGDYLYDVVILDEKKGVPAPMADPSPERDTPKRNITLKENGVNQNVTTNKNNNKFCCKRCGNTDLSYFYKGSRGYYCRKCIGFKRTLIEEDIKVVNYDIKDEAYEYFFKYELTKYQRKASNEILKNIINGKDVLLEAVCGAGKTELVVETMSYFLNHHKKVCYSISRTEVVKELTNRFKSIFKNAKVVGVYGGHHTELTGDLIVCTTHQLFRYYKTFDLLIIDEVDAFPLSGNASLINISLNSCVGNVIFSTATSNSFLKDILTKRDYEKVSLKVRPSLKPLTIPIVRYYFPLIQLFNILLNSNERFIIFVSTKKEVLTIYYLLKYFKNCTYVYSDLKDRDKNIMDFKNNKYDIIVSTSVLERGITINQISVILYMKTNSIMDTSSIIQMIGRVGRGTKYTDGQAYILTNSKYKEIDEVLSYLKEANDALSLL